MLPNIKQLALLIGNSITVRPDTSSDSVVNAVLMAPTVRPDTSSGSVVNAVLMAPTVRPELVEGLIER